MILDEAFRECRLARAGLGRNGDDSASAFARMCESLA
jgi:hypothetical protein